MSNKFIFLSVLISFSLLSCTNNEEDEILNTEPVNERKEINNKKLELDLVQKKDTTNVPTTNTTSRTIDLIETEDGGDPKSVPPRR